MLDATLAACFGAAARIGVPRPLAGGYSGTRLLTVEVDGVDYVVRQMDAEVSVATRRREATCARLAGERGVGPRVLHADDDAMITEKLAGDSLARHPERLRLDEVGTTLRRLHDTPLAEVPPAPSFRQRLEERMARLFDLPADAADVMRRTLDCELQATVFAHNDFNLGNVMDTPHGLRFIDFTDSGRGDPYADLAILADDLALDDPRPLLEAYLGHPPGAAEERRLAGVRALALALAAAWGGRRAGLAGWDEGDLPGYAEMVRAYRAGTFRFDGPADYRTYAAVCLREARRWTR